MLFILIILNNVSKTVKIIALCVAKNLCIHKTLLRGIWIIILVNGYFCISNVLLLMKQLLTTNVKCKG